MEEIKIILQTAPRTKKNSQQIFFNKATGKRMIVPSKQYKEYEQACLWQIRRPKEPISRAVNVKCVYYMPTRRKVDLSNLIEASLDILVRAGVLEDDNCDVAAAQASRRVYYDKENPRAEITITEL